MLEFDVAGEERSLLVEVFDKGIMKDRIIARTTASIGSFDFQQVGNSSRKVAAPFSLKLRNRKDTKYAGTLNGKISFTAAGESPRPDPDDDGVKGKAGGGAVASFDTAGVVTVTAVEGIGLKNVQTLGKQDPLVVFTLPREEKGETAPVNNGGKNPKWTNKVINGRATRSSRISRCPRECGCRAVCTGLRQKNVMSNRPIGSATVSMQGIVGVETSGKAISFASR